MYQIIFRLILYYTRDTYHVRAMCLETGAVGN